MPIFQSKTDKLPGTSYNEVHDRAQLVFYKIKHKTKRKPYIRSAYFHKDKIFFDYFWSHLYQKNLKERTRRLKCFPCAIELITRSVCEPYILPDPHNKRAILYRFAGMTKKKELFFVQIKKINSNSRKYLMSVFPGN